jgi:hypothetical protein
MTKTTMYLLSAPANSGYRENFAGLAEARRQAAHILGLYGRVKAADHAHFQSLDHVERGRIMDTTCRDGQTRDLYRPEYEADLDARAIALMIEVESPDGGTTYCYATQADADADTDGAYAVQYRAVRG